MADERADIAALIESLTVADGTSRRIDTASQPKALDRIGAFIAGILAPRPPDAIGCWLAEDDAVLAHTVAAHLGVPVLRVEADLGLLNLAPDSGLHIATAAIVSPVWTYTHKSATLITFLHNRGIAVTTAISLLADTQPHPETAGVDHIVLTRPDAQAGRAVGAHR